MDLVLWCMWGVVVVGVPPLGLLRRRPAAVDRAIERLAQRSGLAPLPAVRGRIAHRQALQRRWTTIGGGAALAVLTLLVGAAAGWHWSPAVSWTLTGAAMTAAAVGSGVAALQHEPAVPGRRYARATAVTAADYVPRAERLAARLLPVTGLAAITAAVAARPGRAAVPLAGGVLVLAAVLLFELGARSILRTSQPAGSVDALAWDDALRSADLRSLAIAPMAAGAYAGFAAGWSLDPDGSAPLLLAGAIAAVVVAVFSLRAQGGTAGRHFLRRLWPETARRLQALEAEHA